MVRLQGSDLRPQLPLVKQVQPLDWRDDTEGAQRIAALMYPVNQCGPQTLPELIRQLESRVAELRNECARLEAEFATAQDFERFKA